MVVHISFIGVILAAASAMIIGTIWYSPSVFGKQWMKILGVTEKDMKKNMNQAIVWLVLASLLTAYVLAHFMVFAQNYLGGSWLQAGIETALWAWLGLSATTIIAHGVFDTRDKKVLYINIGNRLVTLLTMGFILGLFTK